FDQLLLLLRRQISEGRMINVGLDQIAHHLLVWFFALLEGLKGRLGRHAIRGEQTSAYAPAPSRVRLFPRAEELAHDGHAACACAAVQTAADEEVRLVVVEGS